ncbi:MAG TPA: HmuY family protein, partial [Saprospiraceae bacterium]|nr:HmuY family protein [Saprospiraceae bacterium]
MKWPFLILALITANTVSAQESQEISTGAGYSLQSFVNLGAGTEVQVANNAWDIAFSVTPDDAGVFINESVGSASGLLAIEAYYTLSTDFSTAPDQGIFEQFPQMNLEKTWSYGALNEIRNPDDADDYGWGYLNPETQEITGEYVFVIRLRDGDYLKLQVQSLIDGVFTFRYANFDGSGEETR